MPRAARRTSQSEHLYWFTGKACHVRFGALADMAAALLDVGFTPKADISEHPRHVR